MPECSTENLLTELARELPPVRPVRSLRTTAAILATAFAIAIVVFAIAIVVSGVLGLPLPGRATGVPWSSATFVCVLVGALVAPWLRKSPLESVA
jgi:hypothetical protein